MTPNPDTTNLPADSLSRVERVLETQGRTVAWLARKAGVSVSYAWLMLNGKRPLTPAFRAAAAEALGVPEDILFAPESAGEGSAA